MFRPGCDTATSRSVGHVLKTGTPEHLGTPQKSGGKNKGKTPIETLTLICEMLNVCSICFIHLTYFYVFRVLVQLTCHACRLDKSGWFTVISPPRSWLATHKQLWNNWHNLITMDYLPRIFTFSSRLFLFEVHSNTNLLILIVDFLQILASNFSCS